MPVVSQEVHLRRRPHGAPVPDDFSFARRELADPLPGQILVRNQWISVDPYMRGRMIDRESYIPPFRLGEVMDGSAVGTVERSAHPDFKPGDVVEHFAGWRDYALIDGRAAGHVYDRTVPAQVYLGLLGYPGLSAYAGLLRIAKVKEGDTVFISAASGAVGSAAVQIAKLTGATVIGSTGSDAKDDWLKREAGADAVINYRKVSDLTAALRDAAPKGIDVYFDNVGGDHLNAALAVANPHGRFALCGMIGQYNDAVPPPGPSNIFLAVLKTLTLTGFLVPEHVDLKPDFNRDVSQWLKAGKIRSKDWVVEGLANAPKAFIGLFSGDNIGKTVVKV
jgi:NADPH-dependent curcumin reductase CurA